MKKVIKKGLLLEKQYTSLLDIENEFGSLISRKSTPLHFFLYFALLLVSLPVITGLVILWLKLL